MEGRREGGREGCVAWVSRCGIHHNSLLYISPTFLLDENVSVHSHLALPPSLPPSFPSRIMSGSRRPAPTSSPTRTCSA